MAGEALKPPSLVQFMDTCHASLAFLGQYGFEECPIAQHRARNPFQLWFCAGDRLIIVEGEGWGTSASIHLEHRSGVRLSEIYMVPEAERPGRKMPKKRRKKQPTQLEQVRDAAERVHLFAQDFLQDDLDRFFKLAAPLPTWLQEPR